MSPTTAKLLGAGALLLLAWLFRGRDPGQPARVSSELEIDANVNSPAFGEPIPESNPEVQRLIRESADAIRDYDAAHLIED